MAYRDLTTIASAMHSCIQAMSVLILLRDRSVYSVSPRPISLDLHHISKEVSHGLILTAQAANAPRQVSDGEDPAGGAANDKDNG